MSNRIVRSLAGAALLVGVGCSLLPGQNDLKVGLWDKGAIRITPNDAARTTQSRMTDIDHVLFSLESEDRATNATSTLAIATQSLTYVNGTPATDSVVFGNLWPGSATISATIYGVNPLRTQTMMQPVWQIIGTTSAIVTVVSNQTTQVPLNIKMVDTPTQAGSLNFNLGVEEGDEVLVPYTP